MRRQSLLACGLLLLLLSAPRPGRAIVLIDPDRPDGNVGTPGDQSGWQYEGSFNGFVGTPIAPLFFLTAHHINGNVGDTFTFHGETFTTVAVYNDNASDGTQLTDLHLWKVDHPFAVWAPVYRTGAEIGLELRVFGDGGSRGDPITLDGVLKGWFWNYTSGFRQRWGLNTVEDFVENGTYLRASFDRGGSLNEAHLSTGDSGGGVFVQEDGLWKLAAINYGVDDLAYSNGDAFVGAIFDARGYYYYGENNVLTPVPADPQDVPTSFYSTRVAPRLSAFIEAQTGDLSALPTENYATWLHEFYSPDDIAAGVLTDPNADPEGDGVPNLLEFAFNLDPTFPEPVVLTRDIGSRGLPSVQTDDSGRLTIQYVRRKSSNGPGIVYAAQFASDLVVGDWQTNSAETVTSLNDRWERVTVTDTSGAAGLRFARVQVTTPSMQNVNRKTVVHRRGTK